MLGNVWNVPVLKQLRQSGPLNQMLRLGFGKFWGFFETRQDAEAFIRPSRRITYNDDDIVQINIEQFSQIHLFDWPVLFFLQQFSQKNKLHAVTDLGGHVGVKYIAFRPLVDFPSDLLWQVVDTPAVCREGRKRLSPDTSALRFHEGLESTEPCDVLLCSGVLSYLDRPLDQLIGSLPAPPPMVTLNKVAVTEGEGFYTLESFGSGRMPFGITTVEDIARIRERLGYRLRSHWDIPHRAFDVASAKGHRAVRMIGEVWDRA